MKAKTVILSIALSLFAVSGLFAQDKYEFATLTNNLASIVFLTAENSESIPTKIKESEKDCLRKVNELSDKGWEIYNTTQSSSGATTYYLRKKKN